MLFDIPERIALVDILPQHGNAVTLRLLREFQSALSFTEAERAEIGLKHDGDKFTWEAAKAKSKEIEVGDTMDGLIVTALKKLSQDDRLHMAHLALYDRFVPASVDQP